MAKLTTMQRVNNRIMFSLDSRNAEGLAYRAYIQEKGADLERPDLNALLSEVYALVHSDTRTFPAELLARLKAYAEELGYRSPKW